MNYVLPQHYFAVRSSYGAWLLHDLDAVAKRQLQRHIVAQDYFGTLATVLSLLHQQGEAFDVQELLDELEHLQDNYLIEPRN